MADFFLLITIDNMCFKIIFTKWKQYFTNLIPKNNPKLYFTFSLQ